MSSTPGPEGAATGSAVPGEHASDAAPPIEIAVGGRALLALTKAMSMVGGVFLLAAVAITVASVFGRYVFSAPLPGDYELVEIVCAIAIFLFFPMTHATDGNLRAEFFTSALPLSAKRVLEIIHDMIFMGISGLLAWRMSHALVDKFYNGEFSALLQIPLWIPLTVAVASMALVSLVCLLRIVASFKALGG